jgi:Glycogen recognition site of AMP-activated protein kinase
VRQPASYAAWSGYCNAVGFRTSGDSNIIQQQLKSKAMKDSFVSKETAMGMSRHGSNGLKADDAPSNPKRMPCKAADIVKLQSPIQPVSDRFPALEKREVIFTLLAPGARQVHVAGNFNCWRPDATPLKSTDPGKWLARLMLRSGQYEYRFVVDGRWIEDPQAVQRMVNSYGEFNSVLIVPLAVKTSIL